MENSNIQTVEIIENEPGVQDLSSLLVGKFQTRANAFGQRVVLSNVEGTFP